MPGIEALTTTVPAVAPNVTLVCAIPLAFVLTAAGDTVAAPLVTTNDMVRPATPVPAVFVTATARGVGSTAPGKPTCPLPPEIANCEAPPPGVVVSPPPHAASKAKPMAAHGNKATRGLRVDMQPPKVDAFKICE